ncbi:MAG TPA: amidase [Amaricoccus sp.]|uniref:amidase n=1 Tax=Amaricoccus sp. TaxID=1872485 RepID=UPI001D5151AB|nr:amidase [Amaricoccus sp.]MCB1372679.1 amidase [Paracoccaceae bacterium]MCC0065820.1 amidase [Rhodovulum sp.]MCB1401480.1 amidase [Paracoccaceae bacterium]HPG21717.1 amidase [Amaricoccus sp.]HRW14433.1 amidase [Amaricoccus sp.]
MSELWKLGVLDLARAYAAGETDPVAVLDCLLARIERIDPILNTYARLDPGARAAARESAELIRAGAPRSPLEGVPVAIKDNLAVRDLPAAWGSAVFADTICAEDELPVARLRAAGAIFLGKTNTPEFAVEGYTASERFGVTGNAWDPSLTPGGSSGGSVSAVAAGLAAAAIGTDGGGSVRRPAGHTGLYGLKPTIGTVPRAGGLPQVLLDFEVVGGFARSAGDLAALHAVLAGPDRRDPVSRNAEAALPAGRPLRILYAERIDGNVLDPEIRASVGAAADRLAALGHDVVRGDLPFTLSELNAFWPRFGQVGIAQLRHALPAMSKAGAKYLALADAGDRVTAPEFYAALELVRALRSEASTAFAEWDVIMTPSAAAQPWPASEPFPPEIDGQPVGPRGHAIYTGWVNAAGLPAINLPATPDSRGLPIGFQLVGDRFTEAMLFDLADSWEKAGPGWSWPKVAEQ